METDGISLPQLIEFMKGASVVRKNATLIEHTPSPLTVPTPESAIQP
jgi:hypothetical protein